MRIVRGVGQAVLHGRIMAEVELFLVGILGVPFAAMPGQSSQQLLDREVQLGQFLRLFLACCLQARDGRGLLDDERVTAVHIVR